MIDLARKILLHDKVRFLMVTLDPERDTTAELARFAKDYGLQSPRFEVARTSPDGVRRMVGYHLCDATLGGAHHGGVVGARPNLHDDIEVVARLIEQLLGLHS